MTVAPAIADERARLTALAEDADALGLANVAAELVALRDQLDATEAQTKADAEAAAAAAEQARLEQLRKDTAARILAEAPHLSNGAREALQAVVDAKAKGARP